MNFARLIDISDINPRLANASSLSLDSTTSFVPMAAVSEKSGSIVIEEERPLSEVMKGFTYFQNDDVLVAKITPCFENGKIAHAKIKNTLGFGSTEFHVVRANSNLLDSRYLYYFLRQKRIRFEGERRMTGSAGQRRVPKNFIEDLRIPLPPLDEQRRIAAVLDKADALREKRRQAINKLDTLLQAVFLDMFGDPVKNPRRLPTKPISKFGSVTTGNTPSRSNPEFFGNRIEWIKSDNINSPSHILTKAEEGLSEEGRKVGRFVPAGSSLVTCIAGSPECIGNVGIADREVAFNQQINAISPNNETNPFFLYTQLLLAKRLIQRASTNSMKGMVSKSSFSEVKLLAPDKPLQDEFGLWFERFLSLLRKNADAYELNDNLFYSLQQRVFNGELFNGKGTAAAALPRKTVTTSQPELFD